jgi:hypothetical protein
MSHIISVSQDNEQAFLSRIDRFFNHLRLSNVLQKCNFYKESGFSCVTILKELFALVFRGKNLYRTLTAQRQEVNFRKNTAYRFLNCGRFNWERLLRIFTSKLVSEIDQLTADDRQSVIIFDDSLLSRNRSKKVELLAKVFDHTSHKFFKGFRMLTMGWSDGNTFLPLGFNLLSASKDENVLFEANKQDGRTLAHQRRVKARSNTNDVVIELLRTAKDIPARYVLFDSWFTMPQTVVRVKREKRDVIGMMRITEKAYYQYQDQWIDVKKIYELSGIDHSTSHGILGSVMVKLREDKQSPENELVEARIVFVRDRRSEKWLAILSTDTTIENEEIVRIYGKRWDIEVFFKVCKSYLALAKEFQGRSFDMQVATTTIVFLRYAMLALESRKANDDRTIGDLFYYLREEMADIEFSQSLMLLVDTLRHVLNEMPTLSEALANEIMDSFLNAIPQPLKQRLLFCAQLY